MRPVAASDILLDPIVKAKVVELVPRGGIAVINGGERSRLYLALQDIMHLLKVAIGGLLQVVLIEEEIGILGAHRLRLQEIDGIQSKTFGQLKDRLMAGIRILARTPSRVSR